MEIWQHEREEPRIPQKVLYSVSAAGGRAKHTWEVQTLLNVTKANVWTNQLNARSFSPKRKPNPTESPSCGTNAASGLLTSQVQTEIVSEVVAAER